MKKMPLKFFTSLFGLLYLAFTVTAQPEQGQVIEGIIAKIDDKILLQSELEKSILEFKQQQQQENKEKQFKDEDLKCKVIEQLVVDKLLLAKAEMDSVKVDPNRVDAELDRRIQHLLRAYGGDEELIVENFGKTIDDLKDDIRGRLKDQFIIQKMTGKITEKIDVTPSEVRSFYKNLPRDSVPYFSTEYEVGIITRFPKASADQKKALIEKLKDIRKDLREDKIDFCDAARKYSEDPGTKNNCGDLGYFSRGELVPEYEAAALNLKAGEFSPIVESPFGLHLIQLLDKRGTEFKSRHILLSLSNEDVSSEPTRKKLDSIRSVIMNDSISFSRAATEFSEDKATSANGGFLSDQEGNTMISADKTDIIGPDLYFLISSMKPGEISKPRSFKDDQGKKGLRIVYLKSKKEAHEANLKDDYQRIYKAALAKKKNEAVDEWFEKTQSEVYLSIDDKYKSCQILEK